MTTGLLKGNCLEQLLLIPDASVDSVVTDPPYELGFMGKGWDASGIAYNVEVWKQCFRVLKPGGHLLAFGGTRTYHRMVVAIEDSGFEIRDSIHWTYGSGFPKSHNIGKAIDKQSGAVREEWPTLPMQEKGEVGEISKNRRCAVCLKALASGNPCQCDRTETPITDKAQQWQGWGTALKPSHEPVVVARKPLEGTVANNVLTYGTGALNIDGSRVGSSGENFDNLKGRPIQKLATRREGETDEEYRSRVLESPAQQEALKKLKTLGRWPANTILTHSHSCRQVGVRNEQVPINRTEDWTGFGQVERPDYKQSISDVSTSVWQCVEGCPVLELDEQSGVRKGGTYPAVRGKSDIGAFGGGGTHKDKPNQARQMGDIGGASRYFTNTEYDEIDLPPFIYQAKANSRERSEGLGDLETKQTVGGGGMTNVGDKYGSIKAPAKNFHPTVKPVSLMRHLVRLVTPKGGLVLDPFLGSGTTAVAALLENCQWVGCELTEDYWPIIEGRTTWAQNERNTEKATPTLFESGEKL